MRCGAINYNSPSRKTVRRATIASPERNNMTTVKQKLGIVFILIILLCTLLGVAGVWGLVEGETAWQIFWTLCICALGLGTAAGMMDTFFKDKLTNEAEAK